MITEQNAMNFFTKGISLEGMYMKGTYSLIVQKTVGI